MSESPGLLGMGLDHRARTMVSGNRVLRAIRPGYEREVEALVRHAAIKELMTDGLLIETRVSEERVEGFELVLEHPLIAPLSFPFEWPPSMFKAAALALLELNSRLMSQGFCTVDGHPWNIVFAGTKPVFVDFTAIVPLPQHGRWEEALEFSRTCMSTLVLMSKGFPTEARRLLRDVRAGPDPALANAVMVNHHRYTHLPRGIRDMAKTWGVCQFLFRKLRHRLQEDGSAARTLAGVHRLHGEVESLDVSPPDDMWSTYYDGRLDVGGYDGTENGLKHFQTESPKCRAVCAELERLRPTSVLDIACNRGPYSQIAARMGARVTGIDVEEAALDAMWKDSVRFCSTAQPLYCNIATPAEPVGFQNEGGFPRVSERFRSDCVLCLALIHHLVFRQHRLSFEHVARILSSFAAHHLIVEFVPTTDRALGEYLFQKPPAFLQRFSWYSLQNLRRALGGHFSRIEERASYPEGRVLLVCSRSA